ncbi:hypothetical protein [Pseudomonas putida]|uniref:hypothetical protein n=1 Tax=Pseudomonas putida TaxID=303 RepID=UPI00168BC471|nr:hypothetical protein [Pseudomonas putida]MBI6961317.1 hypothetical protein [Pseudomonas putida]QNL89318.1 Uncharacterized protein PPKH_3904 [Pseudomonas putida]
MTITTTDTRCYTDHLATELGHLGQRLISFGQALQSPNTTVAELQALAKSCGIKLHMRAVAESGEQP